VRSGSVSQALPGADASASGNQAIVHLLSRNTHLQFGFASICVFFVVRCSHRPARLLG
jgi:hypothetical protein